MCLWLPVGSSVDCWSRMDVWKTELSSSICSTVEEETQKGGLKHSDIEGYGLKLETWNFVIY